jgi:hypothetical protein
VNENSAQGPDRERGYRGLEIEVLCREFEALRNRNLGQATFEERSDLCQARNQGSPFG